MNTTDTTTEAIQTVTEEFEVDGEHEAAGPQLTNTVLRIWKEIFSNVDASEASKMPLPEALAILTTHPFMKMDYIGEYTRIYHDLLRAAKGVVEFEIEQHPGCLDNIENDAEDNHAAYLGIVIGWHTLLFEAESAWCWDNKYAEAEAAAILSATQILFSDTGLSAHLEQIGFQIDEDERAMIVAARTGEVEENGE